LFQQAVKIKQNFYDFLSGSKESAINVAMGRRQSQILASESEKIEKINKAQGTEFNYSTT